METNARSLVIATSILGRRVAAVNTITKQEQMGLFVAPEKIWFIGDWAECNGTAIK